MRTFHLVGIKILLFQSHFSHNFSSSHTEIVGTKSQSGLGDENNIKIVLMNGEMAKNKDICALTT